MKLTEFELCANLVSKTKAGVIDELLQCLTNKNKINTEELEEVRKAILKREELGTTAIGYEVAIPHAKHHSLQESMGVIGLSREPINFGDEKSSPEQQKAKLFILLLAPPEKPGDYLRSLATISLAIRDKDFREALINAKTEDEMLTIIKASDFQKTP